jgi:cysteine synthase
MQQARAVARPPLDRFAELRHMIGNTPLLGIHFNFRGKRRVIYAKAEHLNMTGSIKDRSSA